MRKLLVLIFSPAFIFIVYDIVFYYMPIARNEYGLGNHLFLFFMIFCDALAFFSMIIIFFLYRHNTQIKHRPYSVGVGYYNLIILLLVFLIFFLVYSVFNSLNVFKIFTDNQYFYAMSKRGTAWVFMLINMLLFILMIDIYRGFFEKSKTILLVIFLFLYALLGGRSFVMINVMFLFFLVVVVQGVNIKIRYYILSFLFVISIFTVNAILRVGGISLYLENAALVVDFDNAFILNDILYKYDNYIGVNLVFLKDVFDIFVPRYFNPDKLMSTAETRLIYPDVAARGTNLTFGIYANSLLNVGWLTFLFVPAYIIISNLIYFRVVHNPLQNILGFVSLFFLFYSLQFLRGGIFNSRLIFVLISIVMAYSLYLFLRKRRKAKILL